MRKIFTCMALFLVLSLFISAPVYAASTNTYTLDEVGISVALPKDLVVFTRDIDENDPNLEAYGFTADQVTQLLTSDNIYLDAWNENVDFEIIVTMSPSQSGDFSKINDDILAETASTLPEVYAERGITYVKSDIYRTDEAKFLIVHISQIEDGSTVYGLIYYTVVDGKAVNIIMKSYAGKISSSDESYMKAIVDRAVFDGSASSTEPEIPQADTFLFTDSRTNTTFNVPANWTQGPFPGSNIYLQAQLTPDDGSGEVIFFGSYDLWVNMSETQKLGSFGRSQVDSSYMTTANIAQTLGISESQVSEVTYNGVDFYKWNTKTAGLVADEALQMIQLVTIKNGYIYAFQFGGDSSSKHYAEFEALLNSVNFAYAIPSSSTPAASSPSPVPSSFPAQTKPFTYTDIKSDSALTVPAGWAQEPVIDSKYLQVQFIPDDGTGEIIMFGVYDLWVNTPVKDRAGHTRYDVNNSFMTQEALSDIMGVPASQITTTSTYSGEHFKCELKTKASLDTKEILVSKLLYVDNGMMYMFQFAGTGSSKHYQDFKTMVDKAIYSYKAPGGAAAAASAPSSKPVYSSSSGGSTSSSGNFLLDNAVGNLLLGLLITLAIYTLPIVIYRYVIRQSPVEHKIAKRITVIYGICAFIVMCLIIYALGGGMSRSGAIVLWSWVNYKILISGQPKKAAYSSATSSINMTDYYARNGVSQSQPPKQTADMDMRSSPTPDPTASYFSIPPFSMTEETDTTDDDNDDSDSSWGKPLF